MCSGPGTGNLKARSLRGQKGNFKISMKLPQSESLLAFLALKQVVSQLPQNWKSLSSLHVQVHSNESLLKNLTYINQSTSRELYIVNYIGKGLESHMPGLLGWKDKHKQKRSQKTRKPNNF